jgi:hypothetical protein
MTNAQTVKQALNQEIEELRRQKNLTPEGRNARIAKAVRRAEAKLNEMHQEYVKGITDRTDNLQRYVFGFGGTRPDPATMTSIRDARSRASQIEKAADMERMMGMAELDGDAILVKACARECFARSSPLDRSWGDLFAKWEDGNPPMRDALAELRDLRGELDSLMSRIGRDSEFGVMPPKELAGLSNTQINKLAAAADEIGELPPSHAEQVGAHLAKFAQGDVG